MKNKLFVSIFSAMLLVIMILGAIGCAESYPVVPGGAVRFKVATTTSLYDTGLWYYLEPMFEKKYNVAMDIVYAGTGAALKYGQNGDVDAVTVHDPDLEAKFISDGYGINRRKFAYNFYVIAGPANDPAGIKGLAAADAFKKIFDAGNASPDKVKFVSRGDNSGTHGAEQRAWQKAGFKYDDIRKNKWYVESGKGMGPSLQMANEMGAYILTDESTLLSSKSKMTIGILADKKEALFLNVYSAIAVNPEKIKTTKIDIANKLINWLISPEAQSFLTSYGKADYNRPLFYPSSDGNCKMEGCPTIEEYTKAVP